MQMDLDSLKDLFTGQYSIDPNLIMGVMSHIYNCYNYRSELHNLCHRVLSTKAVLFFLLNKC